MYMPGHWLVQLPIEKPNFAEIQFHVNTILVHNNFSLIAVRLHRLLFDEIIYDVPVGSCHLVLNFSFIFQKFD